MRRSGLIHVALAAAALLAAPRGWAIAQDHEPSASEVALAREQFRRGLEAARDSRWEEARESFQRSYDLAPRPITLLNLGGAMVQTGMLVEGAEAYRRFLREVHTGRPARERPAAEQALAALEGRIAYLQIQVSNMAEGDAIAIDGEDVPTAAL